jgi:hypothetical protein
MSITSGIRSVFSMLGPIGDFLGNIVSSVFLWASELITQLYNQKKLNKEEKASLKNQKKLNKEAKKGAKTDKDKLKTEKQITEEQKKQLQQENAQNTNAEKNVALENQQTVEETKQTVEGQKQEIADQHAVASDIQEAVVEKQITGEETQQTVAKQTGNAAGVQENINDAVEAGLEEQITEEEDKQVADQAIGNALGKQEIVNDTIDVGLEKKETSEENKQTGGKLLNAGIDMAGSAAKIPAVGWIIAAAILAMFGIGVGVSHLINVSSDEHKEEKIQEGQNEIYNKKKQNRELSSKQEEYETLLEKRNRTLEEEEQLQSLVESIQGLDESLENKTGKALLNGMIKLQEKNEKTIKKTIDSNYNLALKIDEFAKSAEGQQAIVDKMELLQNDYLEMNGDFTAASESVQNTITQQIGDLSNAFVERVEHLANFTDKD